MESVGAWSVSQALCRVDTPVPSVSRAAWAARAVSESCCCGSDPLGAEEQAAVCFWAHSLGLTFGMEKVDAESLYLAGSQETSVAVCSGEKKVLFYVDQSGSFCHFPVRPCVVPRLPHCSGVNLMARVHARLGAALSNCLPLGPGLGVLLPWSIHLGAPPASCLGRGWPGDTGEPGAQS